MSAREEQRRKLWCDVYKAYVGTENTINIDGGKRWADMALKRYDERFPPTAAEWDHLGCKKCHGLKLVGFGPVAAPCLETPASQQGEKP